MSVPVEEGVDWRFFLRFSEAVPSEKYYFKPLYPKKKKTPYERVMAPLTSPTATHPDASLTSTVVSSELKLYFLVCFKNKN